MAMAKLSKLYTDLLASLKITADPQGLLSYSYEDTVLPAEIDGDRLVLPTQELLRSGNWTNLQPFHPLSEHLNRRESRVLKMLKKVVLLRLYSVLASLMEQFAEIAADSKRHKKLSPKAQLMLAAMDSADGKTQAAVAKLLEVAATDGPNKLLSIYFRRGARFKGQQVPRLAVVSSPVMEEFEGEDYQIFGNKVRKKDFEAIRKLIEYILPGIDDPETYSAPSFGMNAPLFEALINAYAKVAGRLNEVVRIHAKNLPNADDLLIDLSWMDLAADLSVFRDIIPSLPGNEGEHPQGERATEEQEQQEAAQAAQPVNQFKPAPTEFKPLGAAPPAAQPTLAQKVDQFGRDMNTTLATIQTPAAPAVSTARPGTVDFNDLLRTPAPQQQQFAQPVQPQQQFGYMPQTAMAPVHQLPSWVNNPPAGTATPQGLIPNTGGMIAGAPASGYGNNPHMRAPAPPQFGYMAQPVAMQPMNTGFVGMGSAGV